ncbi:TetR family transcriptional regulator [Antricoccus suffuscus]|uniref:TetR family transcriptional regulator n=1 Tax=Antricoccus suffuscus TaxID=1629062 RepID=A0A2T0ZFT5_9ACTN|nr:TetR/AcrR family transcriptional regulator [Antricoccus suffuscus]PRZ35215.1 TetR family transcriptional regulator [Antricoccus suffuscus]
MTQTAQDKIDRISRGSVDKFAERRDQLAESALLTLSELGYARTSLREIAQNSDFSHGVLHYYFRDKVDLITHCVRRYKAVCVQRYDEIVATAQTAEELREGFAAGLAQTLVEDATMHRLWYDLRAQSLFEESFRPDVHDIDQSLERMIWRIVSRYAELSGTTPYLTSAPTYALLDGLFQQSLLTQLSGQADSAKRLRAHVRPVMGRLIHDQ